MKNLFLIFLVSLFTLSSFAQIEIDESKFNLPPGVVFHAKSFENIDYSDKLSIAKPQYSIKKNFMSKFSAEELDYMQSKLPEDYRYYSEALSYFNKLSKSVRRIFSEDDLWYVYMFDNKLKQELLNY